MQQAPLLEFDAALARLLAAAQPLADRGDRPAFETVSTLEADGRIAAADVVATIDVPRDDNSQMDGYAVRVEDWAPGRAFPVSQRIAAGQVGSLLAAGTVARIFTGAPIPPGADAVVMQEEASAAPGAGSGVDGRSGQGPGGEVVLSRRAEPGEWIRRTGEDIARGGVILRRGQRLSPQACGLAASVGVADLTVFRRPRVACFFTGDELTMPGEPLAPGAIYNSNRFFLTALLRRLGAEVLDLGIVGDTLAHTREALREAGRTADLIVTSGGVSVGEEDHIRPAVEAEGRLDLWRLAIKPGRPLAYGVVGGGDGGGSHFIGLPGNPVSSFVTFLLLVRPFLLKLAGASDVLPVALPMVSGFDWPRPDRRREFLRVSVDPATGRLSRFPNQGSAVLTSTVVCDGLVDNPGGQAIAPGDVVRYLPFASLLG